MVVTTSTGHVGVIPDRLDCVQMFIPIGFVFGLHDELLQHSILLAKQLARTTNQEGQLENPSPLSHSTPPSHTPQLLKTLNSNTENPYLIWDNRTRTELTKYLEEQQQSMIRTVRVAMVIEVH